MNPNDEESALCRLLGVGASPVATPENLAAGLRWVVSVFRKELAERPTVGGQVWVRLADIQARYGIGRSQACAWVQRLREMGLVRVQNPISGRSGKGDTFYYLPDIDAAFSENARRA